jgi:hypothetical protein
MVFMARSVLTYLAGLMAHLGELSYLGLVTHSGLLGIAEFVAELGFGTHCDNCFMVG